MFYSLNIKRKKNPWKKQVASQAGISKKIPEFRIP